MEFLHRNRSSLGDSGCAELIQRSGSTSVDIEKQILPVVWLGGSCCEDLSMLLRSPDLCYRLGLAKVCKARSPYEEKGKEKGWGVCIDDSSLLKADIGCPTLEKPQGIKH